MSTLGTTIAAPRKLIAMSDIHGRFDALKLLNLENYIAMGYRIVFMGDYVGYGYKSIQTLRYIISLKRQHPQQVFVLWGNWEDMLYQYLFCKPEGDHRPYSKPLNDFWNKGKESFEKFCQSKEMVSIVEEFPTLLDRGYFEGGYCFTHSGVDLSLVFEQGLSPVDAIIQSPREKHLENSNFCIETQCFPDSPYRFVFGHFPIKKIKEAFQDESDVIAPLLLGCGIAIDFGGSSYKGAIGFIQFDESGQLSYYTVPSMAH